ncbi:MAG: hypothetical protein ACI8TX_001832 [Hyphomicrobiaceae bacterium]|jgi:hypothetical protein
MREVAVSEKILDGRRFIKILVVLLGAEQVVEALGFAGGQSCHRNVSRF